MESFSSTKYSKLDDDRAWSSQEWRIETTTYNGLRRFDKTSWRKGKVRKVRPDHEEIFLDGTAQSVRYGETLRDTSGRLDNINSQEVARPQIFVMVNDETELELSVESRSFANRVNDQVRKKKKNFQRCRRWSRTFYDLVNVHGCNDGFSNINGKEFPRQSEFYCKYRRSHNIHGDICHLLVMKEASIFHARRSTSFQILYCVMGGSIRTRNLTKFGRKG